MTPELSAVLAALKMLVPLQEETVDTFLDLLGQAVEAGDSEVVPTLLMLFDDNCALSGVMDTLSGCLEELPLDGYVTQLLLLLPDFYARSPFWCDHEVRKLLWSDETKNVLLTHLANTSSEAKATLRTILESIEKKTPRLATASASVIEAVDAAREIDGNRPV